MMWASTLVFRILRENRQCCAWFGHDLLILFGHAAPPHVEESDGPKSADDKSTGPWFLTASFGLLSFVVMICHDWLLSTRWHRLVFLYLTCGIIVNHLDAFGLAEVEVRHQVQPKGVLLCQAHMRPASTTFFFGVNFKGLIWCFQCQ